MRAMDTTSPMLGASWASVSRQAVSPASQILARANGIEGHRLIDRGAHGYAALINCGQRVAGAPAAALLTNKNASADQIVDIAQRRIG